MNRRNFLKCLAGAASGFALDPERLLWVPGQRTHFVMPQVWTPRPITKPLSTDDIIAMFKHVYSADRLASIADQEIVLWNTIAKRA